MAAFALPVVIWRPDLLLPVTWAIVAVLAEAAADTCASELGKAYGRKTVLLTNGRTVPRGTEGGVSWIGLGSALLASASVAWTALELHVLSLHDFHSRSRLLSALTLAGVLGCLFLG